MPSWLLRTLLWLFSYRICRDRKIRKLFKKKTMELSRIKREEERERRRVRDKQRRQSMTKEQRERHLARRRRNYQLRRQRSANNAPLMAEALPTPSTSSLHILQGSSIPQEALPSSLRLNVIKRIARNLGTPITMPPAIANHPVAPDFISLSSLSADHGSITTKSKPLRLNCVKRLARSLSFPAEKTAPQNNHSVNGMENGEGIWVATTS